MSKYAPAREDGKKPYVIQKQNPLWGRFDATEYLGWGNNTTEARHDGYPYRKNRGDVFKIRRATLEDIQRPGWEQ